MKLLGAVNCQIKFKNNQNQIEFELIGVLCHMQQYFSHIPYVTAQMCRRIEEEVVGPTVGIPTP